MPMTFADYLLAPDKAVEFGQMGFHLTDEAWGAIATAAAAKVQIKRFPDGAAERAYDEEEARLIKQLEEKIKGYVHG